MQIPESLSFLDLIDSFDPKLVVAVAVILAAALILRIRSGAALDPFDMFRPDEDEQRYGLEDFRRDYNPDEKWNRPPSNHDRM